MSRSSDSSIPSGASPRGAARVGVSRDARNDRLIRDCGLVRCKNPSSLCIHPNRGVESCNQHRWRTSCSRTLRQLLLDPPRHDVVDASQAPEVHWMTLPPIQILVVDRAVPIFRAVRERVSRHADLQVAACVCDGANALQLLESQWIDAVVLGVTPGEDTLNLLKQIRGVDAHVPILLFVPEASTSGAEALTALRSGATKRIGRPSDDNVKAMNRCIDQDLLPAVRNCAESARFRRSRQPAPAMTPTPKHSTAEIAKSDDAPRTCETLPEFDLARREDGVVAIGCSTGGVDALRQILPVLPAGFERPILIVQHILAKFTSVLADELNEKCQLPVYEAREGEELRKGCVLVAPGGRHLELRERRDGKIHVCLTDDPPVNSCRPSVDVSFASTSKIYGELTTGVILTGMGSDGTEGCRQIRERDGTVLVQDRDSCVVWGMPRSVEEAGLANEVLPLAAIGQRIISAHRRKPVGAR